MVHTPGVKISTSTLAGPTNRGTPTARAFLAGVTERGPLTPTSVRSIVAFNTWFGGLQSYSGHLYRAAETYFAEGGTELIVCRAVGTTPTLATLSLVDRTAVTPLPTLKIDAANPGAWATGLTVAITAGRVTDTVTLAVFYGGVRVGYYRDKASVADLVAATVGDPYVTLTDLGAASVGVTRLPAIAAAAPLVGGADDRATVTAASVVAALNRAGLTYGGGAVATPGYNATAVGDLLIAHCAANRRIAILAGDVDSEPSDLIDMATDLDTSGQYAGLFGPWLTIPDGSSTAVVSPEGYVLGVRARILNAEGFWQVPAGTRAAARFARGPVTTYDAVAIDALADGKVCGITVIASDTVLYGWRSLSTNAEQFLLLNAQDVMNTLTALVEEVLQPFVFDTIDATGQPLGRVEGSLVGVLQPIADAGGFIGKFDDTGKEINPAFKVSVAAATDGMSILCTVTVRLSGIAETITVSLVKAAYNATI